MANFLIIEDDKIKIQNLNTYDVWSLSVINGNFMLSKYNGRGNGTVDMELLPNMDDIYGYVELSVNNSPCFKCEVMPINGLTGSTFSVYPKEVVLNGTDTRRMVNVISLSDWYVSEDSNITIDEYVSFCFKYR